MLEQETERIIATVRQRTIDTKQSIMLKEIVAADIPGPLKTFFRSDVETMFAEELQQHRKFSRFNYDLPEVLSLRQMMNPVLIQHYTFDRDDFLQRSIDAVHLLINYLIRPQWTLTNVLFEKDQTISSAALRNALKYFGPYEYVRDIFTRYTRDKNELTFTRTEFSTILWKIDGGYVKRKTGRELAKVTTPIYDFLHYAGEDGEKMLPLKTLVRYFEDKGLSAVLSRLEGEYVQGKQEITNNELAELLDDVRREAGPFEVERLDPKEIPTESGPRERFTGQTQPVAGSADERPHGVVHFDLPSAIDESDGRKFIRKLFKQDEIAFQTKLQVLNRVPTWKEASKVIDEIFIENDVDPYCSEAEKFIEVVFEQYHPNKYVRS